MRVATLVPLSACLVLAACGRETAEPIPETAEPAGPSAAAAPDTPAETAQVTEASTAAGPAPARRPGRWRMTTFVSGVQTPSVVTVCVTEENARQVNAAGERQGADLCSERSVTREGDDIVTRAVCQAPNGGSQIIESRSSGDFTQDYRMMATVTLDPPSAPDVGPVRSNIRAQWLGECDGSEDAAA